MAPTFRSSRSGRQFAESSNRSRTSAAEHDIFEGLPIRRWTRQSHTVSQDAKMEIPDNTTETVKANQPFPELPMPKDSHLLAPHSRALLRAARAGYIYLRPATKDTQTGDERETNDIDETSSSLKMERSYTARKWTQMPRHVEPAEVEFLAKRRAGLPSLYGASGAVTAAVPNASQLMRKAKIRKVDPETGNIFIYDAWIPEGQKVEGEFKEESQSARQDVTVTKANPAPGTVIEGVGVANAEGIVVASTAVESPSKRKGPPPPKRKAKGLKGKGRKKVMFAPGEGAEVGGEDQMVIDGEQEDEEDDEEGEEGEDAEEGEETDKPEEASVVEGTPQTETPLQTAAPTLDLDATPSLPPTTEDSNISPTQGFQASGSPEKPASVNASEGQLSESPKIEPIKARSESPDKPRTPVQPQSEQLTPPDIPVSIETAVSHDQETHEEMKLDTDVQDVAPMSEAPPLQPHTDLMDDVQPTPASALPLDPAVPVADQVEAIETIRPAEEGPVDIQTEVKVEQLTNNLDQTPPMNSSTVPIASETLVQPTTVASSASPDLLGSLENSLSKEPTQPIQAVSEVKIEEPTSAAITTTTEVIVEPTVAPPPLEPILAPAPTEAEAEARGQSEGEIAAPAPIIEPVGIPESATVPVPVPEPEPAFPLAEEIVQENIRAQTPPTLSPAKEEVAADSAPQPSLDKPAESSEQPPQSS